MADAIFENPRLAAIYDEFDGDRKDLDLYRTMAIEMGAQDIIDIGCGTGSFVCLLSENGFNVTGLDPAKASLEIAKSKPYAEKVRWILGDTTVLPPMKVDLVFMTGNVAQVFLTDDSWTQTLLRVRESLRPKGYFVFEVRDPAKKAWQNWNKEKTYQSKRVKKLGTIEGWCEVTDVSGEFISFRWTYKFEDGETITSDSTIRFREREAIIESLETSGFEVLRILDAPDRKGQEFVFVASLSPY